MEAKRMYQEPKMKVVNIDPTAMICQSPIDPSGEMSGGNEEPNEVKEMLLDIWQ